MPNYRRVRDGNTWFFTVVAKHRALILTQPAVRHILEEVLVELRRNHPFQIQAWVLLPDHIHCIWRLPENDVQYSMRWGWLKKEVTKRLGKRESIWQPRFWEHQIRDDRDYAAHCDYIHYNPVKHGLVTVPRDWPWSTFHRFMRAGIYSPSWGSEEIPIPDGVGHEWGGLCPPTGMAGTACPTILFCEIPLASQRSRGLLHTPCASAA